MKRKKLKLRTETTNEIALKMIKDGSLSYEKIALFTGIPVEKIKQLTEKVTVEV